MKKIIENKVEFIFNNSNLFWILRGTIKNIYPNNSINMIEINDSNNLIHLVGVPNENIIDVLDINTNLNAEQLC
jgi:hypothetical protein